jgi:hypothetical protein
MRTFHLTTNSKGIVDELADWIDTRNLACEIIDAHQVYWPDLSLERCKDLWLRALDNLADFLQAESRYLPDPADEE